MRGSLSEVLMGLGRILGVEINPKLSSIELTKLLENYARNTQMETEYVE